MDNAPLTHKVTIPDDLRREINLGAIILGATPTITLLIAGDVLNPLPVAVEDEILLGRADPVRDTHPDIDLTPYNAAQHGVSRRHARIIFRDGLLRIEDLNSVNGTFLNGLQLQPHDQRLLRGNDNIQLGTLRIRVQIS